MKLAWHITALIIVNTIILFLPEESNVTSTIEAGQQIQTSPRLKRESAETQNSRKLYDYLNIEFAQSGNAINNPNFKQHQ